MLQRGIVIPSPKVIENWRKITENPLVSTYHAIVPDVGFLSYQTDSQYDIPIELFKDLSAFQIYSKGCVIRNHTQKIDKLIVLIYPLRSRTKLLKHELQESNATEAEIAIKAVEMRTEILNDFIRIKSDCLGAISKIIDDFKDTEMWVKGMYSDFYVDSVCELLGKLFTFGLICQNKTALIADLTILSTLTKCSIDMSLIPPEIGNWICPFNEIKEEFMRSLKNVSFENTKRIFKVFWKRISYVEENKLVLDSETKVNYLLTFLLMIDFYMMRMKDERKIQTKKFCLKKLDSSVIEYLVEQKEKNPSILVAFDVSSSFDMFLAGGKELLKEYEQKNKKKSDYSFKNILPELLSQLKKSYENLVYPHTNLIIKETVDKKEIQQYIDILFQTLKLINNSIYSFKHLVIDKHGKINLGSITKDEEGNSVKFPPSQYEIAIKSIDDSIKESMAHLISICCQLRNIILKDVSIIQQTFSKFIESCLQDFVVNQIDTMLYNSAGVSKYFEDDVKKLKELLGHFNNDETKNKKSKEDNYIVSTIIPNITVIRILRTQLQSFINPENPMMSTKMLAKNIYKSDLQAIQNFLLQSEFWEKMLNIEKFIEQECDESILYFQEYCIDIYQYHVQNYTTSIVYFPITTSIPYVLTEYIISQSSKHELIELLYYPLSIYDSAAKRALNYFGSRAMFEEIRAESQISILTICNMIADFAFDGIKMFAYEKFHDKNDLKLLNKKSSFEEVAALKIASVLQQNQLFLLGNHIDIKSLFSKRLNELFLSNLRNLISFISQFGILGIFVFSNSVNILHDVYNTLLQYDVLLDPFENILLTAMSAESLNTFNSKFLDLILKHFKTSVLRKYKAYINPFRLYPTYEESISISQYISSRDKNIPSVLKQTTTFISINHFKELTKILGSGGIFIILTNLKQYLGQSFSSFVENYSKVKKNIIRIPDLPMGSGCHKSYDRYDGAYRTYLNDSEINELLLLMQTVGNIIILMHMVDVGYSLFRISNSQAQAFIFMLKRDDIDNTGTDIFNMFDNDYKSKQNYFNGITIAPSKDEIVYPFSNQILEVLKDIINENLELFEEKSTNILDFPSLSGFSSIWSVLEFIYILKEVHYNEKKKSIRFGCGVIFCAASIINLTNQYNLSKLLCIGTKIENQKETDIVSLQEEILTKLINVSVFVRSIFDYAISLLNSGFKTSFSISDNKIPFEEEEEINENQND